MNHTEAPNEVTLRDFQKLVLKRKRTVDDLVDTFHGKLDENRSFFERVMSVSGATPIPGALRIAGTLRSRSKASSNFT